MENQSAFIASDGVDPNRVPGRKLYTGDTIPGIGLGTFGSDRFSGEAIAEAVTGAISVGYRHIDCASVYGNEHLIGHSLKICTGPGHPPRRLMDYLQAVE